MVGQSDSEREKYYKMCECKTISGLVNDIFQQCIGEEKTSFNDNSNVFYQLAIIERTLEGLNDALKDWENLVKNISSKYNIPMEDIHSLFKETFEE
jgi:hypothetical protein